MIASVAGVVLHVEACAVIVNLNGIGVRVETTSQHARTVQAGDPLTLHTTLIVREDSLTLYGFAAPADRQAFDVLQSVSGIGPRTALSVLDVYSGGQLADIITSGDEAALMMVPGIGKRSAQRLILELSARVAALSAPTATDAASGHPGEQAILEEVIAGLVNLGYRKTDAEAATRETLRARDPHTGGSAETGELLVSALQHLGRK